MSAFEAPYRDELRRCESRVQLSQLWQKYAPFEPAAHKQAQADWEARAAEIDQEQANSRSFSTAREALDNIDLQSLQATLDYGDALNDYAAAHTDKKKREAAVKLLAKAGKLEGLTPEMQLAYDQAKKPLTDGMAQMFADVDEEVATLRLAEYIADGRVKAAKATLDHLERSFQYHRSLMVREDRVDGR